MNRHMEMLRFTTTEKLPVELRGDLERTREESEEEYEDEEGPRGRAVDAVLYVRIAVQVIATTHSIR